MTKPFDYFVIFAEMRTGSNFLETNLNAFSDITCFGEAFNPAFIGYPNSEDILGVRQRARDKDANSLLDAIKGFEGIGGFRYFHDHDPRILDQILDDPKCAKVILTRNPAESYVSWKIAKQTNQWKLTNVNRRIEAKAHFEASEFETHVATLQEFQILLMNRLQANGQTAFYIDYEDLQSLDIINGLGRFLGSGYQLEALDKSLKPQNPESLADKVENFEAMETAVARMDRFNLSRTPNFEPRRGPVIPGYVAAEKSPIIFLPIRSGPEANILKWLADLDAVAEDKLQGKFTQKTLRQWMKDNQGHRSFTVLRHPAARAHAAFCSRILSTDEGSFVHIRETLRTKSGLDIPEIMPDPSYSRDRHRAAFLEFLQFLKKNLNGQTTIRVDANWATQATCVQGMGEFVSPDFVIREEELEKMLPLVCSSASVSNCPKVLPTEPEGPFNLGDIYDAEVEAAVFDTYQRDYIMFGFGPWQ